MLVLTLKSFSQSETKTQKDCAEGQDDLAGRCNALLPNACELEFIALHVDHTPIVSPPDAVLGVIVEAARAYQCNWTRSQRWGVRF